MTFIHYKPNSHGRLEAIQETLGTTITSAGNRRIVTLPREHVPHCGRPCDVCFTTHKRGFSIHIRCKGAVR